jgi:hypothetical protein
MMPQAALSRIPVISTVRFLQPGKKAENNISKERYLHI